MRIRVIQQDLISVIKNADINPLAFAVGVEDSVSSDLFELILAAKSMAAELLQEENPKKTLVDAVLQVLIIASLLGIDLEKEIEKELMRLKLATGSCS